MKGHLIQLLGDGIEELYWFPIEEMDDTIKFIYRRFLFDDEGYDNFENYWNSFHDNCQIERVFVTEIYI